MSGYRLGAMAVLGVAVVVIAVGVLRGVTPTGPAHGERLIVAIDLPLDGDAIALTEHAARERVEEKGEVRVERAGDRLVIEIGSDAQDYVDDLVALLERTGK